MAKKPATKVDLRYPLQYIFSCLANRFAIEKEDGFRLVHFGLLDRSDKVLEHFRCVIPEYTVLAQKENLVQYLEKSPTAEKVVPKWSPPAIDAREALTGFGSLSVIDFIHVAYWDDNAEICFWNYSRGHVADAAKSISKEQLLTWGVAMIRCELGFQKAFITSLYEE